MKKKISGDRQVLAEADAQSRRLRAEKLDRALSVIRKRHAEGLRDAEIAVLLGWSTSVVAEWRRKLGLPAHSKTGVGTFLPSGMP